MSERDVFDYEGIIEAAVKTVLTDSQLTVLTSGEVADFQEPRARVEVVFTLGAGLQRWVPRNVLPAELAASKVESAFKGALDTTIITPTTAGGKSVMAEYRSKIRRLYASLAERLNQVLLPDFRLQLDKEAGTARAIAPQEGYELLKMSHDLDFSIQSTAWEKLNQ